MLFANYIYWVFLKHSRAFNFFFLYSICHQNEKKFAQYSLSAGRFSRPLPYKSPPPPPPPTLSSDTSWHVVYFVLEDTNKQTVRSYQNKWFHKSTFSAETGPSETLLGRG